MNIIKYSDPEYQGEIDQLINRSDVDFQAEDKTVRDIIEAIRNEGDVALIRYTNQFDGTDYSLEQLRVLPQEIKAAYGKLESGALDALKLAADNIQKFHQKQVQDSWEYKEGGALLGQLVRPLATVGIYVPGGKASYPSSVLMNAIPARVAGVDRIIMVSPTPGGEISAACLVAADLAGVDQIYKVGGAQAVAALALGTTQIPRVDKIVGPGNIYVALAKRLVFGLVDIDMIAGPSEILVVADNSARADFVAADLLSQAEHDEQAVPILVTTSETLAQETQKELVKQTGQLSRKSIIEASLNNKCRLLVTRNLEEAVDLANQIAPEHLELAVENPHEWVKKVRNAGAVFLGHYTPEALGDYLAGPNHVLPTSGTARFSSPLGVYDFIKRTSIISYNKEELGRVQEACCTLAEMENLEAHANAVRVRLT